MLGQYSQVGLIPARSHIPAPPGLGTFWLAATLGTSNTRFKKLSKKDLLACNVPKACQKLIEPDEPLVRLMATSHVCQNPMPTS